MQSQERRLEMYRMIYVWKIIEGLVPNCGIETITNERLGRFCKLPSRNVMLKYQNLEKIVSKLKGLSSLTHCQKNLEKKLIATWRISKAYWTNTFQEFQMSQTFLELITPQVE